MEPAVSYDPAQQAFADEEHLRLLSIGYYVSAAMTALFSLLGLMYGVMGVFIGLAVSKAVENTSIEHSQAPPQFLGWMVGIIGIGLFGFMILMAALKLRAGLCIKRKQSRTFCMVIAALSCLEIPYGTLLGVFTFIVLERPTVSRLFSGRSPIIPTSRV
jgi:hypothetical protein